MQGLLLLAAAAGAGLSVQAGINSRLGRELGSAAWAALASVIVSTLSMVVFVLATRAPAPSLRAAGQVPVLGWSGGLFGAFFVALAIIAAPRVGVAAFTSFVVAGNVAMGVVLDHYGLLGLEQHPVNPARLVGMVLLILGVILVKRF